MRRRETDRRNERRVEGMREGIKGWRKEGVDKRMRG